MRHIDKGFGFTLIELVAVISILSILANIAIFTYRHFKDQQYDTEAISDLNNLYFQASQLVSDWGVYVDNSAKQNGTMAIKAGTCLGWNPANLGSGNAAPFDTELSQWKKYGIEIEPGPTHWSYNICFGVIDSASQVEGFLVVASHLLGEDSDGGPERLILYGSGIQNPIVDATQIPSGATLENITMSNISRLSSTLSPSP